MNLNLAETLKRLRKEKDLTQEDVASELGVTFQSVSRWENGQSYPDIELLPAIAALYDVSLDKLFSVDKESEGAKIEKFTEEELALGDDVDARITLAKKYVLKNPNCTYFKMRLIELYHSLGLEKAKPKLDEMRSFCRFIIDHPTDDSWVRDNAISCLIDVEDEDRVDEWLKLLDNRSVKTSQEARRDRYKYQGEIDKYNLAVQNYLRNSLWDCFLTGLRKSNKNSYFNAQSSVEGHRLILKVIDVFRDPDIELDAWIFNDRPLFLRRLAAACFGAGLIDEGYAAMEKDIELLKLLSETPVGTKLRFNSPALDLIEYTVDREMIDAELQAAIFGYTATSGWEWFNGVRGEERFISLVESIPKPESV